MKSLQFAIFVWRDGKLPDLHMILICFEITDQTMILYLTRSRCFIKHFFVAVQYLRVFEFFKF